MFARVAAVVLALVVLAAGAAGIWALALEQDERNCIAAAEAANPVKVIPTESAYRPTRKGLRCGVPLAEPMRSQPVEL